jgi:sec-independent protein translocase protein TatB
MFDIGFWELVVIGVVALIVIGPERLPGVARTAGLWVGKAKHFIFSVKAEVDRELKADELKRLLEEQSKIGSQVHEFIEDTRKDIKTAVSDSEPESGMDSNNSEDSKQIGKHDTSQ